MENEPATSRITSKLIGMQGAIKEHKKQALPPQNRSCRTSWRNIPKEVLTFDNI